MSEETVETAAEHLEEEKVERTEAPGPVSDAEMKARALGWRPQEEFRGAADKWVDAETFLERGEQVMPLLKAQNKKLRKELDEMRKALDDVKNHSLRVQKKELEGMMTQIRQLKADAVARGDGDALVHLEDQQAQILSQAIELEQGGGQKPASTPQISPEDAAIVRGWQQKNSWYGHDVELTRATDLFGSQIVSLNPDIDKADLFNQVDSLLRRQFPHKFQRGGTRAPAVDAGRSVGSKPGAKSYNNLPADAKAACDRLVSQKVLTRDEYVKYYEWEK